MVVNKYFHKLIFKNTMLEMTVLNKMKKIMPMIKISQTSFSELTKELYSKKIQNFKIQSVLNPMFFPQK